MKKSEGIKILHKIMKTKGKKSLRSIKWHLCAVFESWLQPVVVKESCKPIALNRTIDLFLSNNRWDNYVLNQKFLLTFRSKLCF